MTTNRSAFTLIELMVAVLAGAVFALLVGSMLIFSYQGWSDNNRKVEQHRDASLAMDTIGRLIRQARMGEDQVHRSEDGRTLYFESTGTTNVSWLGAQLIYNPSGLPLVRDGVLNFLASDANLDNTWDVILQLYDPESGGSITMTGSFTPRNKSEEE
ncbi:MAG: type II secretion system protein [Pontiellaceae bacterium]|nr:type II secretion system protein [Pontiellaceae bacterium]MBN2783248.1 type II secretion system protein [Pontiellaceae bacterium]